MAAQILLPPPLPQPSSGRFVRIEYLDFQSVAEHREFRLRAYGPDGSAEFRFRIAVAAFDAGRVRLQDGPDVCYQKVLRAVAAGETPSPDVISIDDLELASYRVAHTPVPKHRSFNPSPTPIQAIVPRVPPRTSSPRLPVAQRVIPENGNHPGKSYERQGQEPFGHDRTDPHDEVCRR